MIDAALYTNVFGLLTCLHHRYPLVELDLPRYTLAPDSSPEERTRLYTLVFEDLTADKLETATTHQLYACDKSVFSNASLENHSFFKTICLHRVMTLVSTGVMKDLEDEEWEKRVFPYVHNIIKYSIISKHVGTTLGDFEDIATSFMQKYPGLSQSDCQAKLIESLFTDSDMKQKLTATISNPSKIMHIMNSATELLSGLNILPSMTTETAPDPPPEELVLAETGTISLSSSFKKVKAKKNKQQKNTNPIADFMSQLQQCAGTMTESDVQSMAGSVSEMLQNEQMGKMISTIIQGGQTFDLSALMECMQTQ